MRTELEKIDGIRQKFTGEFVRTGEKPGWQGDILETVLLRNISNMAGKTVSDHLWFNMTEGFRVLLLDAEEGEELKSGDKVEFCARVATYEKGYQGRRAEEEGYGETAIDFKLSHPTKIRKVALILEKVKLIPGC